MDFGEQRPWRFQFAIDERGVQNQLGPFVSDLRLPPLFHLAPHRFEASLDPVNTHCKRVDQVEALCMLGQNWRECGRDNVAKSVLPSHWGLERQSTTLNEVPGGAPPLCEQSRQIEDHPGGRRVGDPPRRKAFKGFAARALSFFPDSA